MENELACWSQNYCWLVGDQILISCKTMISFIIFILYDLDFFVIFCLNVKMYD